VAGNGRRSRIVNMIDDTMIGDGRAKSTPSPDGQIRLDRLRSRNRRVQPKSAFLTLTARSWARSSRPAPGRFEPFAEPSGNDSCLRILVIATAIGEGPESAHIRDVPLMGAEGALPGPARLSSSSALSLDPAPRACLRHGPQSLANGFRPLVQARPSGRPTPGQLDQRQALRWPEETRPAAGVRPQALAPGRGQE
jgi:hypothetical protein